MHVVGPLLVTGGILLLLFHLLLIRRRHRFLEQTIAQRTAELQREVDGHRLVADQLRLYELAIRDMSEGVLITDASPDPGGFRVLMVNDALCRLSGYTREELIGGRSGVLHGPATLPSATDPAAKDLFSRGQLCQGRSVHYRKDKSTFIVECNASPLHDAQGCVTHYVSIQRDVTAQVEAEQARARAEAALRESRERLQAILDHTPAMVFLKDLKGEVPPDEPRVGHPAPPLPRTGGREDC